MFPTKQELAISHSKLRFIQFLKFQSASASISSRRMIEFLILISCLLTLVWVGISVGASKVDFMLPLVSLPELLFHNTGDFNNTIVADIRLPRVLIALMIGAGLAVSGASLQGICRNPLADPGLLGISSGAAVGAALMILYSKHLISLEFSFVSPYLVSIAAFLGAAISTFTVYRLAQSGGEFQIATLLLAGVAINALSGAIIGGLSFVADDQSLRLVTFWMMGSLSGATWNSVLIVAVVLCIALVLIFQKRHALNLMLLGEANARYSGIDVEKTKNHILLITALVVGVATAFSGIIGFIGLVVPHILRGISDTNYRYLIINCTLLGGGLLVAADIFSRMLIVPAEIPIGIITSLIGAPFFMMLLIKQKKKLGIHL